MQVNHRAVKVGAADNLADSVINHAVRADLANGIAVQVVNRLVNKVIRVVVKDGYNAHGVAFFIYHNTAGKACAYDFAAGIADRAVFPNYTDIVICLAVYGTTDQTHCFGCRVGGGGGYTRLYARSITSNAAYFHAGNGSVTLTDGAVSCDSADRSAVTVQNIPANKAGSGSGGSQRNKAHGLS